jgi:hypothetical protein
MKKTRLHKAVVITIMVSAAMAISTQGESSSRCANNDPYCMDVFDQQVGVTASESQYGGLSITSSYSGGDSGAGSGGSGAGTASLPDPSDQDTGLTPRGIAFKSNEKELIHLTCKYECWPSQTYIEDANEWNRAFFPTLPYNPSIGSTWILSGCYNPGESCPDFIMRSGPCYLQSVRQDSAC